MAKRVSCYLDSINDTSENFLEMFSDLFTLDELKVSMKQSSNTNFFNPDGFHVKLIKNLGPNTKTFLLEVYNRCWDMQYGPGLCHEWCLSGNPTKTGMTTAPATDRYPLLVILATFLSVNNNVLPDEQEGFRRKRNTVRSLYRLHLNLEHARITKTPTALLSIGLEKAFDSVLIDGLLYKLRHYHVNGKMFSIIPTFLKNREAIIELADYLSPAFKIDIGVPRVASCHHYCL